MRVTSSIPRHNAGRPVVYTVVIALGLICGFVAYLLIVLVDIESVVVSGPFEFIIGLAILIMAANKEHWLGVAVGSAMIAVSMMLAILVNALAWSPREALVPFLYIGGIYLLFTTPLFILAWRTVPSVRQEWQCPGCGYLIYGLQSPKCPECGIALDPSLVTKYRHQAPKQA